MGGRERWERGIGKGGRLLPEPSDPTSGPSLPTDHAVVTRDALADTIWQGRHNPGAIKDSDFDAALDALVAELDDALADRNFWKNAVDEVALAIAAERDRYRAALEQLADAQTGAAVLADREIAREALHG